jgi:predicted signal transduction protein with EAL and GGDEF domain
VTASLGITIFPLDDTDAEHLLRNADTAMYRAKEAGRDSFQFYTAEMNAQAQERLGIENDLRRAIAQQEFVLHFQPQVDIASGRIIGAEALLRWNHPEKGMIPPAKFIPIAEESGLIVPIGEWVLRDACRQLRAWQLSGLPSLRIAVNLSARQFREPNLAQRIAGIMAECGLENREVLEVEITESLLMKNVEVARDMLKQLFDMGVRISVDDFGTGYSSLSYLRLEGRSILRARHYHRRGRRCHCRRDRGSGPQAQTQRNRGRRRNPGPVGISGADRLRRNTGILFQPPAPGGGVRGPRAPGP